MQFLFVSSSQRKVKSILIPSQKGTWKILKVFRKIKFHLSTIRKVIASLRELYPFSPSEPTRLHLRHSNHLLKNDKFPKKIDSLFTFFIWEENLSEKVSHMQKHTDGCYFNISQIHIYPATIKHHVFNNQSIKGGSLGFSWNIHHTIRTLEKCDEGGMKTLYYMKK